MVKVRNTAGDKYKGKIGDQFYQGLYDFSVRKAQYHQKRPSTEKQLESQQTFKDSVNWIKTLDGELREAYKTIYRNLYKQYQPGQPANWFNFCKSIYIKKPTIRFDYPSKGYYTVYHPGLYSVSELDDDGNIIYSISSLSDIPNYIITDHYTNVILPDCYQISIETTPGLITVLPVPSGNRPAPSYPYCVPCMRTTELIVRAIDSTIITDDCWQLDGDEKTDFVNDDFEYGHFI